MRACLVVIAVVVATIGRLSAEPVAVRYLAGLTHGFVSVKTTNGRLLGGGELIQTVRGDRVTSRLLPQLEPFPFSGVRRQVTHDILNVDIGGLKGIAAKLFGKQPPDSHIWIMEGDAPAFVRAETPIATGDPPSVLELSGPVFKQP